MLKKKCGLRLTRIQHKGEKTLRDLWMNFLSRNWIAVQQNLKEERIRHGKRQSLSRKLNQHLRKGNYEKAQTLIKSLQTLNWRVR